MKKLLCLIFCCCACTAAFAQSAAAAGWVSIKAFLSHWNGAVVHLQINGVPVHTDTVRGDMYSFRGTAAETMPALLQIKRGATFLSVPFFIEAGTIKIRDVGHNKLVAYGTGTNNHYISLQQQFDSLSSIAHLSNPLEVSEYKQALAAEYIRQHPASLTSLQLLNDYYFLAGKPNDSAYYALFKLLGSSLQQTSLGTKIGEEAIVNHATAPGRPAPLFSIPDTAGNRLRLFEEGPYTLINFWASWCVPCRKENAALLRLFNKYKDKGFTITGVSIDTDKKRWQKAIQQDSLPWKQLSELSGWESRAAKTYGVKAVPANFLIDERGTIVARNISLEEIEAMLSKVPDERNRNLKAF